MELQRVGHNWATEQQNNGVCRRVLYPGAEGEERERQSGSRREISATLLHPEIWRF